MTNTKSRLRIVFLIVFGFLVVPVNAQPEQFQIKLNEEKRMNHAKRAAEEKAFADFPLAKELRSQLMSATTPRLCDQAVDPYVIQNERRIIPYLKAHLQLYDHCRLAIDVALVKLGDEENYQKIIADLKSEEIVIRYVAIEKLALIRSKESYRKLYELLDDASGGKNGSDYIVLPVNRQVVENLSRTVEDGPKGMDRFSVEAWKAWFERNRHLID